tara:strand:- start:135 stop:944 length:810 start_codon:yes stop_codon:yes gene_type:complete
MNSSSITILGCGNIGSAMVRGFVKSGISKNNICITRRKIDRLNSLSNEGYKTSTDNITAVKESNTIILAVGPNQLIDLLDEINPYLTANHLIVSVVSGVSISEIQSKINIKNIQIVRAMPNTAATLCESMTCLSAVNESKNGMKHAQALFNKIGKTLIIDEEQMGSATALCACGVAFFLRAIRAASQGGIEIGFHSEDAMAIAAQTARGAATLLFDNQGHPESEIDRVTTPMGATISGLNEMEHQGFSSAMIKGIITSTEKINKLFDQK